MVIVTVTAQATGNEDEEGYGGIGKRKKMEGANRKTKIAE